MVPRRVARRLLTGCTQVARRLLAGCSQVARKLLAGCSQVARKVAQFCPLAGRKRDNNKERNFTAILAQEAKGSDPALCAAA